ncbi:MAG: 2-hydroxychromene-2-carboxylate isomerase [Candidatus Lambdaproteobacteria bacterium]|nr:2-hydroxychromene-2-carboxylate isomerase [Candidatus Lambdaproteobacteria bacterium]
MSKTVEFFFDFGSNYSYLAWASLPGFVQRTGARVLLRPMLLGGLWKAVGNRPPVEVEAKGRWLFKDVERCARKAGIPYVKNSAFPIMTIGLMRGAVAAEDDGLLEPYVAAMFPAMWRDDRNLADPAVASEVLLAAGLDARRLLQHSEDPAVKERLKANTEEAQRRGAFGAPSFFVGDELFWGFDRMHFVEDALA